MLKNMLLHFLVILNSYPYVLPESTTGRQPKCPRDKAIRPTINSSIFLDRRLLNDIDYGLNISSSSVSPIWIMYCIV